MEEEENEGWNFPYRNPLLYPHIIHQIFTTCDICTLKLCRLVCKFWEDEVNRILPVKKCPIVLSSESVGDWVQEIEEKGSSITNNVILDGRMSSELCLKIKSAFHHSPFKLEFLEIQSGPWTASQLRNVLHDLPNLKELTLSQNFILPKTDNQSREKKHKPMNLTNLHSLHLNLRDDYLQNLANGEFLIELCTSAPNLGQITCDGNRFSEPGFPSTTIFSKLLFRTVLDIFGGGTNSLVTRLDINVDLRDEDVDLLHAAHLPLRYVHLPLNAGILPEKIDALLTSLKGSLKRLKMTYRSSACKLPALKSIRNLKHLAVHGTGSEMMGLDNHFRYRRRSNFGIGFGPTNTFTPENKSSETNQYKYTDLDLDIGQTIYYVFNVVPVSLFPEEEPFSVPLLALRELCLNAVYYIPKDVSKLGTFFPNVKRLKMPFLDDDLLHAVIKSFPSLEALGATEGFFTDTILTGISPEVQDVLKNVKVSRAYNTRNLREFPSLRNLSSERCTLVLQMKMGIGFSY
ncbi:hypothetical protein Fcan01_14121 [Folsomia candida]|uniref:F-box domain-containing protein n=1 Tax=Folsomia candida TaxID=158441 RepID=A0A226DZ06_FOLCA|nr:hypothetical protein Fcan01_14121 [Folsomia candida]